MDDKLFGGFKLFQFPHTEYCQMMSYGLMDNGGNFIMIDGGNTAEGVYLEEFLLENNLNVSAWLITHAHSDHIDALTYILKRNKIKINCIYFNFPDKDWLYKCEPDSKESTDAFLAAVKDSGIKIVKPQKGEEYKNGEILFRALTEPTENLSDNIINNSTVVYSIKTANKNILFLGDIEISAGNRLLKDFPELVRCDVVQMAHHGQHGVNEAFYQAVNPEVCLWPTPVWLYENDSGKGYDSGEWETLKTRDWMKKLGVKRNYVSENKFEVIE